MAEVSSPIRKFLENVEVAEDLTDSMLEEEQAKAMAQLHDSDLVDDSGYILDDSGYSSVSSAAAAAAAAAEQKSSVTASVYDSIVDTLEKILPIDEFDDFEEDDASYASDTSNDLPKLPQPPALQRELSIENIQAMGAVKALSEEEEHTAEADVTPEEMGVEESEFIAAIEGAILKEFGGASDDSVPEPNVAVATTEEKEKVNDENIQSAGTDKLELEGQQSTEETTMSAAQTETERKDAKPRSSRGIFAARRSKQAAHKPRSAKMGRTDSRLAQKYSSSSRMKDISAKLTEEALKRLDIETRQKKVCFDEKTKMREKPTPPKDDQNNDETVESDDQYSSGSSGTDFDSDTETEVETEVEKDLLDAFIDFLVFQGRSRNEDEEKPKRERSPSKGKRFSQRRKKKRKKEDRNRKALGTDVSLEDDDEESCQYESLINIPGVRSSDSFTADAEELPIKKPSEEVESHELPDKDPDDGTPGGLKFDATFFEELWKEAVVTLKKTKLFESTPQKPTARSTSVPSLTHKEEIETSYRPLVDDLLQDVVVHEEGSIRLLSTSEPSSDYLDKVAQAASPLDVPPPKNSADRLAKADLTLNHFQAKYPVLSKKLDPAKLGSIVKVHDPIDGGVKEVYASGKDLNEELLGTSQRADMNLENVSEVDNNPIAADDSSFMRDLHESNVVSQDNGSTEENVECSLDDSRNVFSVLKHIGIIGVSGQPSKRFALDSRSKSTDTAVKQKETSTPSTVTNKSPFRSFGALRKTQRTIPERSRSTPAIRPVPENANLTKAKNAHEPAGNYWEAKAQRKPSTTKRATKKQESKTSLPSQSTMPQSTEPKVIRKDSKLVDEYSRRHGILGLMQNRSRSSPRSAQVDPAESKSTGNRPKSPWARRGRKENAVKHPKMSPAKSVSDDQEKKTVGKAGLSIDPVPKKRWPRRRRASSSSTSKSVASTSQVSYEAPRGKLSFSSDSERQPRDKITVVDDIEGTTKDKSSRESSDAAKMSALNCTDTSHSSSEEEVPQTPETPRTLSMVDWQGFPPVDGFEKTRSREPRLLFRIRSVNPFGRRQSSTTPKQACNPRPREQSVPSEQVIEWDDFPEIDFSKSASAPGNFENRKDDGDTAREQANLYTEGEFDFDMFERSSTTPISN